MNKDKMKKAVSPLVSVVILVSFVVMIAYVITGWMNAFVHQSKESTDKKMYEEVLCGNEVDFSIWVYNGQSMVCLNDTKKVIVAYIENKGKNLQGLYIRLSNATQSKIITINNTWEKYEVKSIQINYSDIQDFLEVKIYPYILRTEDRAIVMCRDAYITIEKSDLPYCNYLTLVG